MKKLFFSKKTLYVLLCTLISCNNIDNVSDNPNKSSDSLCEYNILYDEREYLSNGETNRFLGLSNFDTTNTLCWNYLAEQYSNLVPDTLTKVQHSYFIMTDANQPKIKSIKQILNSKEIQKRVIGLHEDNRVDVDSFKEFPFE